MLNLVPGCWETDVDYAGGNLISSSHEINVENCKTRCGKSIFCDFYTFMNNFEFGFFKISSAFKNCFLWNLTPFVQRERQTGMVSSLKNCTKICKS